MKKGVGMVKRRARIASWCCWAKRTRHRDLLIFGPPHESETDDATKGDVASFDVSLFTDRNWDFP